MRLTIYKYKEIGKFIFVCLFLTGFFHVAWTILCFQLDVPRGY